MRHQYIGLLFLAAPPYSPLFRGIPPLFISPETLDTVSSAALEVPTWASHLSTSLPFKAELPVLKRRIPWRSSATPNG